MSNQNNENQMLIADMNIEYYPVQTDKSELSISSSLSLSDLTSLGASFAPVTQALKSVMDQGSKQATKQLYELDMGDKVGSLMQRKNGQGFTSAIVDSKKNIIGQATLKPVDVPSIPMDPAALAMAVALASIEKKLGEIKGIQEDIFDYLQLQEKAKLEGNLNVLNEVMNNYKHNWNNEKYKTNKHILVQEIKRDSEHSIIFHKERIKKKLAKERIIHGDQEVKKKISILVSEMKDYQLALYLYSFSEFIEVMLLENFDSKYLGSIIKKNESYAYEYRSLYTDVYNKIEKSSNSSVESVLLTGVAGLNKIVGKTVAKVPVLGSTKLDETMIESAEKVDEYKAKRGNTTMSQLKSIQKTVVTPFVDNLKILDEVYNQGTEIMFDSNNLYLVHSDSER